MYGAIVGVIIFSVMMLLEFVVLDPTSMPTPVQHTLGFLDGSWLTNQVPHGFECNGDMGCHLEKGFFENLPLRVTISGVFCLLQFMILGLIIGLFIKRKGKRRKKK